MKGQSIKSDFSHKSYTEKHFEGNREGIKQNRKKPVADRFIYTTDLCRIKITIKQQTNI